ncbi:MAG: ABC transporter ATP-binding protein [Desulfurococcales archaeon]|nr:ABC transporter ATP-binding protein [Desulfurococcales archaeon]
MSLLEVNDLKKYFPVEGGVFDRVLGRVRGYVKAVDGISFTVERGETLGLIGESGCGKTTTGKVVLRLLEPTAGKIVFDDMDITRLKGEGLRRLRRRMQMIFQDPFANLDPRMPVGDQIAEPLIEHGLTSEEEAKEFAYKMLSRVGLTPVEDFYERLPLNLSGGQRQRVVIARAMSLKPDFVVADEAVSMIDVSMRASIVKLLLEFKRELNQAMIFITHDISIGRLVADRIAVMYLGKIVEIGRTEDIINNPAHPYTQALLAAVPTIEDKKLKVNIKIKGEVADPKNVPPGCRFHPRCPLASDICMKEEPRMIEIGKDHFVACHHHI